jgi:hypothetical protein
MIDDQIERNAKELIRHGGICAEADLTCYTCPVRELCLKGKLAGKNRTEFHKNIKVEAEKILSK